jgi:hypothetical protein
MYRDWKAANVNTTSDGGRPLHAKDCHIKQLKEK